MQKHCEHVVKNLGAEMETRRSGTGLKKVWDHGPGLSFSFSLASMRTRGADSDALG